MKFVLHLDALNGDDKVLDLIDRLIDRVVDEVHRVEIPGSDQLKETKWYQSARSTRRKVLTKAASIPPRRGGLSSEPHSKNLNIRNINDAQLADKLAHCPFIILVEDRDSDGIFLDIVVEELGSEELKRLWARGSTITPKAIEIVTSGGIDAMPQRIQRLLVDAAAEGHPFKGLVLCDSDVRWPGDNAPTKETRNKIEKLCIENSIPFHALKKRNIENYIPDAVFQSLRAEPFNQHQTHRFDAFLRLTPIQRDHFPVKDGLTEAECNSAIAAGLYSHEDRPDLELLKERLIPKRPRPFIRIHTERRDQITAIELRSRDSSYELDSLLERIAKEI